MNNTKDTLRKMFAIGLAAFEMQHTISTAFGYKGNKSYMHHLYIIAKDEIDKECPDMQIIDKILQIMETEANNNK